MALAPAREAFMPPPTPGLGRSVLMALVAHAALVLALLHTMPDTSREALANALASTAESARNANQPSSAEFH